MTKCGTSNGFTAATSSANARCTKCSTGTYSSTNDAQACSSHTNGDCGSGFDFRAGTFASDSGCVACSTGFFSATTDKIACAAHTNSACATGESFVAGTSSADSTCSSCPPGQYASGSGKLDCTTHSNANCPASQGFVAGTRTANSGCVNCVAGTSFSGGSSADVCALVTVKTCVSGIGLTEATVTADGLCTACEVGKTWKAGTNANACAAVAVTSCAVSNGLSPATTTRDGVCSACVLGASFSATDSSEVCRDVTVKSCGAGLELAPATTSKNGECSTCAIGYFSAMDDNACKTYSQSSCSQGFTFVEGSSKMDTACIACADGFFNPTGGTTSCKAHTYSSCQPGLGFTAGSSTTDTRCTPCVAGTFSMSNNDGDCVAHSKNSCPPGEGFTTGTARADDASCTACGSGKYSASTDALACTPHSTSSCSSTHKLVPGSAKADDAKCVVLPPVIVGYSSGANTAYTRNKRIDENQPTVGSSGGTPTSYAIDPALPSGLFFSTSTGSISGQASSVYARTVHDVRATNAGGTSSTFAVAITVLPIPPKITSYGGTGSGAGGIATITFTKDKEVSPTAPSMSGDDAAWQVSPALPSGLVMSTTTGVITGKPTAVVVSGTGNDWGYVSHTVTARNDGGTSQYVLKVRVVDQIPSLLQYDRNRISFDIHGGAAFVENRPVLHATSGGTPTGFTVAPALPTGLSFNVRTGAITGNVANMVPVLPSNHYVKALNSGGESTGVSVSIELKDSTTLPPLLTSPANIVGRTLLLDMTLSEAASPGSVTITFTPVANAPSGAKTVVLTMESGWASKGQHVHTIPSSSALENGGAVTSVLPSSGVALLDGAEYNVKLSYIDTSSNAKAQTENKVRIDRTAPTGAVIQIVDSSVSTATVHLTTSDMGQVFWMARTSGDDAGITAGVLKQGCTDNSASASASTSTTTCVSGTFALATSTYGIDTLTKAVLRGLPSGKQMSVWFALVDAVGNTASDAYVVSTKTIISTAADQIAPVTTITMPLATSETSATVEVDSSEAVAVYMLAVPLAVAVASSGATAPAAPDFGIITGPSNKTYSANVFDAAAANAFYVKCGGPGATELSVVRAVVAAGAGSSTHLFDGLKSGVSYAVYAVSLDEAVPPNMGSIIATVITQPDLTAPAFIRGYPIVSILSETMVKVQVKMDGPGKVHYVVELNGGNAKGGGRRRVNAAVETDQKASERIALGQTAQGGVAFLKGTVAVGGVDNIGQVLITGLPRGGVSALVSMVAQDAEGNMIVPPLVLPGIQFTDESPPEMASGYPRLLTSPSSSNSSTVGIDRKQAEVEISVDDGSFSKGCTVSWIAILKDPSEAFEQNEAKLVRPSAGGGGGVGVANVTSEDVRATVVTGLSVFKSGSVTLLSSSSSTAGTTSRPKIGKIILSSLPEGQDAVIFLVAIDESVQRNAMAAPLRFLLDRNTVAPLLALPSRGHLYGAAGIPVEFTLPEQAMPGSVHLLVTIRDGSGGKGEPTRVVFGSSFESVGVHKTVLSASSLKMTPVEAIVPVVSSTLSGRTVPTFEDKPNINVGEVRRPAVSSSSSPSTATALVDGAEYDVQLVYQDTSGNPVAQGELLQPTPGGSSDAGITIKRVAPSLSYTMVQTATSTTSSSGPDKVNIDFGDNTGGGSSLGGTAAVPFLPSAPSTPSATGPGSIGTTLGSAATAASAEGERSSGSIRLTLSGPGSVFWVALAWDAKAPSPKNIIRGTNNAGGAAFAQGVVDMAGTFDFTAPATLMRSSAYQSLVTQVVANIEAPSATAPAKVDRVMPRHDPMGVGISLHLATVDLLGNVGSATVSVQPAMCPVDSLAKSLGSNGVAVQAVDLCKTFISAGNTENKIVPYGVGCGIKRLDHKCDVAFCGQDGTWIGGVCASAMGEGISNLDLGASSIIGALDVFNPAMPLSATNMPEATNLTAVAPLLAEKTVERVELAATALVSTAVATAVVSSVVSVTASAVTSAIAAGFVAGSTGALTGAASTASIAGSAVGSAGGAGGAALPLLLTMQTLSMTTKLKVMQAMGEESTYQRIFSNIEWTNFQFDAFPFTMLVGDKGNESANGTAVSFASADSPSSSWTNALPAASASSSSDTASALSSVNTAGGPVDGNSSFAGDCAWRYNWDPDCTQPCGGGTQQGMLQVTRWPSKGGELCPTVVSAERACNTQDCRKAGTSTVPYAERCSDVVVPGAKSSMRSKAVSLFVNNVFWVTLILTVLVIFHLIVVACLQRKHRHHSRKHEEKIRNLPPIGSLSDPVKEGKVGGDKALSAAEKVRAVHGLNRDPSDIKHHSRLRRKSMQKKLSFRIIEKAMPPLALPRLELMLMILTYQGVCLSAFSALDRELEWYVVFAAIVIAVFPIGMIIFVVLKLRCEVLKRRTASWDPKQQRWVSVQARGENRLVRRGDGSRGGSVEGVPSPTRSSSGAWGEKDEEPTSFHGPLSANSLARTRTRMAKKLSFHGLDSIDLDSGRSASGEGGLQKSKSESFKDKAKRLEMGIVERYGVLFDDFKPQYYLWKPVKFLLQMTTGLLLSGLLPISAVAQSGTLMFVYLFYCVASLVLRPHVHWWKNVFEVVFSLGYALVFFGSIMLIKADCWGLVVSDVEVYMIVVSALMTVILVLKVVLDGARKLGWKKVCCILTCGASKLCKRKDDAVTSLFQADAACNDSTFGQDNPMTRATKTNSAAAAPPGSPKFGRSIERIVGRHGSSVNFGGHGGAEGKSQRENVVEVRNPSFIRRKAGANKLTSGAPSAYAYGTTPIALHGVDDVQLSFDVDTPLSSAGAAVAAHASINATKKSSLSKGLTSNRRPSKRPSLAPKRPSLKASSGAPQSQYKANTAKKGELDSEDDESELSFDIDPSLSPAGAAAAAERAAAAAHGAAPPLKGLIHSEGELFVHSYTSGDRAPSYEDHGTSPPAYDDRMSDGAAPGVVSTPSPLPTPRSRTASVERREGRFGSRAVPTPELPKIRKSANEAIRRSMEPAEARRIRRGSTFVGKGLRKKQFEPTPAAVDEEEEDELVVDFHSNPMREMMESKVGIQPKTKKAAKKQPAKEQPERKLPSLFAGSASNRKAERRAAARAGGRDGVRTPVSVTRPRPVSPMKVVENTTDTTTTTTNRRRLSRGESQGEDPTVIEEEETTTTVTSTRVVTQLVEDDEEEITESLTDDEGDGGMWV